MNTLTGRVAIVTGAGKGIGKAIATRLFAEDAKGVAIFEWDEELAKKTAKELDPSGERVIAVKCDVSNTEMVKAAVDVVLEKFGTVDILVNNAGITKDAMFHKMSDDQWNAVMNVNLKGIYNTCKYCVPVMKEKEYGRIVNIASVSYWGNVGQTNYSASKGGVMGFTGTLAKEYAAKGIVANCVAPGMIDTDMLQAIPAPILEAKLAATPMHRCGSPEELAAIVNFLCGPDCSYLTGQCLVASGAIHSNF